MTTNQDEPARARLKVVLREYRDAELFIDVESEPWQKVFDAQAALKHNAPEVYEVDDAAWSATRRRVIDVFILGEVAADGTTPLT